MRKPLERGTELHANYDFIIDSVIGGGANGLVYDAYFYDSRHNKKPVRIKECFPVGDSALRDGQGLCWTSQSEKESAFAQFDHSYQISSQIQNEVAINQSGTYTLDIFECNDTEYIAIIPDHGVSYDKDRSDSIADAIKTVLALTKVIAEYHRLGYLHLDIKPNNFIAVDDSTGQGKNIILFDTDTVTSIEDIQAGMISSVSYSKGWAAPEQIQQKIGKICLATDLFSIGAILFDRVMKRPISSEDMSALAEWEYDERLQGPDINPAVRSLLTEIFHKTLSANVKRRYDSADILAGKLEQVLDLLTNKRPYIATKLPPVSGLCIGREDEIAELHTALSTAGQAVIMGAGGIGKSTLARYYAKQYRNEYDAVVLLRYDSTTSIKELLDTIPIGNISVVDDKYEILQTVCNERTLIILDNLDIGVDEEDIDLLLNLNCRCIITTRTDFRDVYPDIPMIQLFGLDFNHLRTMFEAESGRNLTDQEFLTLMPFAHLGTECTLFWHLLSKLVKTGNYTVEEVCDQFSSGLAAFENTERVLVYKDGRREKVTIDDAMSELFRITNLSDIQMEMLQTVHFLVSLGITKQTIEKIAETDDSVSLHRLMDVINDLTELGYVEQTEDGRLFLSDVLGETIIHDSHPELSKLVLVDGLIKHKFFIEFEQLQYDTMTSELGIDQERSYYNCLVKIFGRADMEIDSNAEYMVDLLIDPVCRDITIGNYICGKALQFLLRELMNISQNKDRPVKLRIKALSISVGLSASYMRPGGSEESQLAAAEYCRHSFMQASQLLGKANISDRELDDLCLPIADNPNSSSRIRLLDAETIDTLIHLDPPCINRKESVIRQFKIRALMNIPYQKLYLQRANKVVDGLSPAEAKEYCYTTIGRILCSHCTTWASVDREHFDLLKKFYGNCSEKFDDFSKINSADFVDEPLQMPIEILLGRSLNSLKVLMSYDTYDDVQNTINSTRRHNNFKENGNKDITEFDLSAFCEAINSANNMENLYRYLDAGIIFAFGIDKKYAFERSEQLLKLMDALENAASFIEQVPVDSSFTNEFFDDIYQPQVAVLIYALSTIICIALENLQSAEKWFDRYLDSACMELRYNDFDLEVYSADECLTSWLWWIVNSVSKLSSPVAGLSFLVKYIETAERKMNYPEATFYFLYKETVSLAQAAIKSVPLCKERILQALESDDDYRNKDVYSGFPGAEILNFAIPIRQKYSKKMEEIFSPEFNSML